MRLTELTIDNFRSIGPSQVITFVSNRCVLVGGNNAGKSNILAALDWVLGGRAPYQLRAEAEDFFDPSHPIKIEAVLGDASAMDKSALMGVATNQKQRGKLSKETDPRVSLTLTIPALDPADNEEAGGSDEGDSPNKPTLVVNLWGFDIFQKTAAKRRDLVSTVTVQANRRVGDDLRASQWTPYGQLMKSVLEESSGYGEVLRLLDELNDKIHQVFETQKASLLRDARIASYVDDISFRLTKENKPSELLRNLEVFVTEGTRTINIDRMGTGTQSAVIMSMFELVLMARTSRLRILVTEEPEAFIHPHGVRRLSELIARVAEGSNTQVIVSTHSPALLPKLAPSDVIRVTRNGVRTEVHQASGALSDPSFSRYVNQETAEMFCANRVVLTEGLTERVLLPPISQLVEVAGQPLDLDRLGISVISMNGKDAVVQYLSILDEFNIPRFAILDADFLTGSSKTPLIKYLRSKGAAIDDSTGDTLRKGLLAAGIIVLSKGEIEDYIPIADVATVSGRTEADVKAAISGAKKRSDAFKSTAVFAMSKPLYARALADHYLSVGSVPSDISRLITAVCK